MSNDINIDAHDDIVTELPTIVTFGDEDYCAMPEDVESFVVAITAPTLDIIKRRPVNTVLWNDRSYKTPAPKKMILDRGCFACNEDFEKAYREVDTMGELVEYVTKTGTRVTARDELIRVAKAYLDLDEHESLTDIERVDYTWFISPLDGPEREEKNFATLVEGPSEGQLIEFAQTIRFNLSSAAPTRLDGVIKRA